MKVYDDVFLKFDNILANDNPEIQKIQNISALCILQAKLNFSESFT